MSHQPNPSTVASTTITATPPKPQELKLGQPSTFNGDPKKARAWINNTQLYLPVTKDVYDHDNKKVAFTLSFMKEGSARLWALTETETAFANNLPGFGTWSDFLKRFNDSFILGNTERQRCFDNNLCFKCRKPRHISSKCQNPFMNKQKQPTTTTTKIKEIPDDEDSATFRRISTMDF